MALTYFSVVRQVWTASRDAAHFLDRLTTGDYPVATDDEDFVRENIRLKQEGRLPRERGSTKRPYEQSWQYALEHFDVTKEILRDVPLEIRSEPMEGETFREYIRGQNNLWIYCSNITEFHYFDLTLTDTSNVVVLQIIFPGRPQLLDLAPLGGAPVKVRFEIPLQAERL
jgi:hypothetical protein